jgi:hypothetical protein
MLKLMSMAPIAGMCLPLGPAANVKDQLPAAAGRIMANDIEVSVVAADLHIAVVGAGPAVEGLRHLDHPAAEAQAPRRRRIALIGVAFKNNVDRVHAGSSQGSLFPPRLPMHCAGGRCRAPRHGGMSIMALILDGRMLLFSFQSALFKVVDTVRPLQYVWRRNGVRANRLRSKDPQF